MSDDWEDLVEDDSEDVATGRFERAWKVGKMGAKVTASSLANKIGNAFRGGDEESRREAMRESLEKNAARAAEVLGDLKGASMKVGQLLSADPELLPDGFSDQLAALQRDAPPMPYETVRDQIESAFDQPLESVFSYFDDEPAGSASLGQVHRARLEDGTDVAVKIQYPGVADALDSDLKTLKSALVYARVVADKERLEAYFSQIRDLLREELDYENEAANLRRFHRMLADRQGVEVPEPIDEWTRETVLVMEYMEGEKLDDVLREMSDDTRRNEVMRRWIQLYSWMFHEQHEIHADPHPGNFLLTEDDTIVVLDFGSTRQYDPEFTDGYLDILDACWQDDRQRAVDALLELGYGGDIDREDVDPDLVAEYNSIILAPFLQNEPFDFGEWEPAREGQKFMMRHPSFLKLTPPPESLPYMRVLSGIKGLLRKLDARFEIASMAVETARRRGRLTGPPVVFEN